MRGAFGRPTGTCARVQIGQVLLSIRCKDNHAPVVSCVCVRERFCCRAHIPQSLPCRPPRLCVAPSSNSLAAKRSLRLGTGEIRGTRGLRGFFDPAGCGRIILLRLLTLPSISRAQGLHAVQARRLHRVEEGGPPGVAGRSHHAPQLQVRMREHAACRMLSSRLLLSAAGALWLTARPATSSRTPRASTPRPTTRRRGLC